MPLASQRVFERTLQRVEGLVSLHPVIHGTRGRPAQYVSDLLRGTLVLGIAALDALVADSVTEAVPTLAERGALGETFIKWIKDEAETVLACFARDDPYQALADVCRNQLTIQTFQKASAIEGVLRGVLGCAAPWQRAAQELSDPTRQWTPDEVKARLDESVNRRNRIVHNGDLLGQAGTTRPIQRPYVEESARVIRAVGVAVLAVVSDRLAATRIAA